MKKIDKLFLDFPKLKVLEKWIRATVQGKNRHPIKWVFRRYVTRKPRRLDEAISILRSANSDWNDVFWANWYIDHCYAGSALLAHLNHCFEHLEHSPNFMAVLKNLKNSEQFFDTISEIEFNAYFSNRYQLELEPKIYYAEKKFKRLDSKIKFFKRPVYFEVLTPRMSKKLFSSKVAVALSDRSKGKFLDKVEAQIVPIKEVLRSPVVLVINTSYSEIDERTVENAILGEQQFTLLIDNKTGKTVDIRHTRADNALVDTHPLSSCISAIVCVNRLVKPQGLVFRKSIIVNKKSDFPLTAQEYRALNRFDLRKIGKATKK